MIPPRPSGNAFQDICTMVGLMTLTWAWAENSLAITLGAINEHAGPIEGHAEPPLSLKRRIACFKIALRDIAALKPLQEEGRVLAMRFGQLGGRRNELIHGAAWQLQEGSFESVSIAVEGRDYAVKNHRFDIRDAHALCVEIAKLQDEMAEFMMKIVALFQA